MYLDQRNELDSDDWFRRVEMLGWDREMESLKKLDEHGMFSRDCFDLI